MQRQVLAIIGLALLVSAIARSTRADERTPAAAAARIVNVTSDSAPGWVPSPDQAQAARKAVLAYLAAKDAGRSDVAYAMLEDGDKTTQPLADFSRDLVSFNSRAGAVVERRIVNVTWTKNPPQAPKSGIYAAVDIVSRFANIDRDCGYVAVYQPSATSPFRVVREESNFLTNADAATIERERSKAVMEANWAKLAERCPNYPGWEPPTPTSPLPEQAESIGYATVADALKDLRSRPGIAFQSQAGWTIATDDASHTIWVFASEGQPAYPAAIKRQIVRDKDGGTSLEMSVLCEASKADCDDLVRNFEALNARMTKQLRNGG